MAADVDAPDPLDRPAEAMAAALAAWCKDPANTCSGGVWLNGWGWDRWDDCQRDLARRLAAAALAAGREQPDVGGATMTAEDLSEAVIRHLQDVGCVIIPDAADGLTPVLAAAVRQAAIAAMARQRAADAARAASWMNAFDREMAAVLGEFILSGNLGMGGRP